MDYGSMSPALSPHWILVLLKGTQPQAPPDLEEEIVYRDYTMVTVSMGIALTGIRSIKRSNVHLAQMGRNSGMFATQRG